MRQANSEQCTVLPLLPGFPTDRIPTLAQVLDALRGLTVIDVDVKVGTAELAGQLVEQVVAAGMTEQVMLLTRNVDQARFYESVGVCDVVGPRCYQLLVKSGAELIQTDRLALLGWYLEKPGQDPAAP